MRFRINVAPCRANVDGMTEQRSAEWRKYGPEVVATRLAARRAIRQITRSVPAAGAQPPALPLVLVALSGGADSLALALATAHEAARGGVRAGAIIVDHALQLGSHEVAEAAAAHAQTAGLDPVLIHRVSVQPDRGGPEAAARNARYAAFAAAAAETGARAIFTAHTRDDQAEQVLLGLARGSGLRSLAGIPEQRELASHTDTGPTGAGVRSSSHDTMLLRPFLGVDPVITRRVTEAACTDQDAEFWRDPHNADLRYARVRVRQRVLPVLEAELGPGLANALARTADLAREDADALEQIAAEHALKLLGPPVAELSFAEPLQVPVSAVSGLASAIRNRVIRELARRRFGVQLEREHTLAIAALVTDWRGQGAIYVPGIVVHRRLGELCFERQTR